MLLLLVWSIQLCMASAAGKGCVQEHRHTCATSPPVCTAEKAHLYYGDVEVVVLDEADTMFDRGFGPEARPLSRALG